MSNFSTPLLKKGKELCADEQAKKKKKNQNNVKSTSKKIELHVIEIINMWLNWIKSTSKKNIKIISNENIHPFPKDNKFPPDWNKTENLCRIQRCSQRRTQTFLFIYLIFLFFLTFLNNMGCTPGKKMFWNKIINLPN